MSDQKATNKRLTFVAEEADQMLLAAAEEVVAAGKFATFNDLCKTALDTFLHTSSDEAQTPATVVSDYTAQLSNGGSRHQR